MMLALLLAAQAQTVAVLEFRDKVPSEQRIDAGYLSDQVRAAVKELLPSARVITRENMLVLLQASGKDLADCEGECEVDTGRRIGADLVVSGELLRFGTQYKLNMKLHDTRSGELMTGAVASGTTADELDGHLRPAVGKLLAPLLRNQLSDQRAEARKAEESSGIRPTLSARAAIGFGSVTGDSRLLGAQSSEGALAPGLGADAGVRLSRGLSIGAFVDYTSVQTATNVTAWVYGAVARFWAGKTSIPVGVGISHLGTGLDGPGFLAGLDYVLWGPIALHAHVIYAHESNGSGLFDGANSAFVAAFGLSAIY
jgi:hypothetical protein